MTTSNGIEKVVALANVSPEWKEKVLAGPLDAADEAGLELSESERAIVSSVPPATLERMIESLGRKMSRPAGILKLTAGAAAAALLAGSLAGCDGCLAKSRGISPDRPPAKKTDEPEKPADGSKATQGARPDVPEAKPESSK
jgi:hypothetical protein